MNRFTLLCMLALLLAGCKPAVKAGDLGTFSLGERAPVGTMIYSVIDSQWMGSLGQEPAPRLPQARFYIMNITAVNSGSANQSLPTFVLEDESGGDTPELENGEGVPNWVGFGRQVRPAESISGNIAFDVPPKHYKLKITDEDQQNFAYIDLPLSFGSPTVAPPEPGPAPIKK